MKNLKAILQGKTFEIVKTRKRNPLYEQGVALEQQLGNIPLNICIRLVKTYTMEELGELVSWWKDYPFKREDNIGLLWWKMKQIRSKRK